MQQRIEIQMNRFIDVLKIQFRCGLDGVKKINGQKAKDIYRSKVKLTNQTL